MARLGIVTAIGVVGLLIARPHVIHEATPAPHAIRVLVPTKKLVGDGKLTDEQCYAIRKGTSRYEIISRYGYPRGDQWMAPYTFFFPIKGAKYRACTLDFDSEDEVRAKNLDLP